MTYIAYRDAALLKKIFLILMIFFLVENEDRENYSTVPLPTLHSGNSQDQSQGKMGKIARQLAI